MQEAQLRRSRTMTEQQRRERLEREVHQIHEMENGIPDSAILELVRRFLPNIFCNLVCFVAIYIVLQRAENQSEGCGIPVFDWM